MRKKLKERFPDATFCVRSRSYNLGAFVEVSWSDGPNELDIGTICSEFEGANLDGVRGLKTYRKPIEIDGERVYSGADFILRSRTTSMP